MDLSLRGKFELEDFSGDDTGAVEDVVEPEIGSEGMMRCGGDDAIVELVAGSETENAHRFYADVLVDGQADYGGIGLIGDGAGENVGGAAAGVRNVHGRDLDLLECAVVVEIEACELVYSEFVIDMDAGVNFLAGVTVGFEADVSFEEFDLGGDFWRRRFLRVQRQLEKGECEEELEMAAVHGSQFRVRGDAGKARVGERLREWQWCGQVQSGF